MAAEACGLNRKCAYVYAIQGICLPGSFDSDDVEPPILSLDCQLRGPAEVLKELNKSRGATAIIREAGKAKKKP